MTSETIHSRKGTPYRVSSVPTSTHPDRTLVELDAGGLRAEFSRVGAERLAEALLEAARGYGVDREAKPADSSSWTGAWHAEKAKEAPDSIHITGVTSFIEAFQRAMGLRIDGIVGPETIAALKRLAEGHADRPASAGDIDAAVDRILYAVTGSEVGVQRMKAGALADDLHRANAEIERLTKALEKRDRDEKAIDVHRTAKWRRMQDKVTTLDRVIADMTSERDAARQQRDDYKRRLDAYERDNVVVGTPHTMQMDAAAGWHTFPRGRWALKGFRVDSAGRLALDLEPVDG